MTEFDPFPCAECGAAVELRRGPGRTAAYRVDVDLPVPPDFAIPTCTGCGERYLTADESRELSAAQAPLYPAWQRERVQPLIRTIQGAHGVTLKQIEEVCAVSRTYLSHVANGTKEASRTLLNLLEAYAREPQEFQRKLQKQPWNAPRECWPLAKSSFLESGPIGGGAQRTTSRLVVPPPREADYTIGRSLVPGDTPANDLVASCL
jgi:transcriptional regulator with XRE-family HTH domain